MKNSRLPAIRVGAAAASTILLAATTTVAQTDLSSIDLDAFETRTLQVPLVGPANLQGLLTGPHFGQSSPNAGGLPSGGNGAAGLTNLAGPFGHGGAEIPEFEGTNSPAVLEVIGEATLIIDPEWAHTLIDHMEAEEW